MQGPLSEMFGIKGERPARRFSVSNVGQVGGKKVFRTSTSFIDQSVEAESVAGLAMSLGTPQP